MISGYPVPQTSTLNFNDIYSGGGSMAPSVEKATNPAPTNTGKTNAKAKHEGNSVTGGSVAGLEVPLIVTLGVIAVFLVYKY